MNFRLQSRKDGTMKFSGSKNCICIYIYYRSLSASVIGRKDEKLIFESLGRSVVHNVKEPMR